MLTSILGIPFRSHFCSSVSVFSSCPFTYFTPDSTIVCKHTSSTELKYRKTLVYWSNTAVCLFYFSPPAVPGIVPVLVAVILGGILVMVLVMVMWKNSRGECSKQLLDSCQFSVGYASAMNLCLVIALQSCSAVHTVNP